MRRRGEGAGLTGLGWLGRESVRAGVHVGIFLHREVVIADCIGKKP